MRKMIYHRGENFVLVSYGNGWAFDMINLPEKLSIWFQDGDAVEFQSELESLTEAQPNLDYENALHCIWNDYSEIARPMDETVNREIADWICRFDAAWARVNISTPAN